MYHTQEKRQYRLTDPIICTKDNAWLGDAYYFWKEEVDAIHWGNKSKKRTGKYEVYKARIDHTNVLDTVFNEEHYRFWLVQIEKAAKKITKKTGYKATIKEINQYFKNKAKWSEITSGILFQDIPKSADLLVTDFFYRKRIQLAVYDKQIIKEFTFHLEDECI